jgi:hypothetical protein
LGLNVVVNRNGVRARRHIEIKSEFRTGEATALPRVVTQRQVIRAQPRPGGPHGDHGYRKTTLSMFGTDWGIKSFQLDIRPLADPGEKRSCQT